MVLYCQVIPNWSLTCLKILAPISCVKKLIWTPDGVDFHGYQLESSLYLARSPDYLKGEDYCLTILEQNDLQVFTDKLGTQLETLREHCFKIKFHLEEDSVLLWPLDFLGFFFI